MTDAEILTARRAGLSKERGASARRSRSRRPKRPCEQTAALVRRLRDRVIPAAGGGTGLRVYVGGKPPAALIALLGLLLLAVVFAASWCRRPGCAAEQPEGTMSAGRAIRTRVSSALGGGDVELAYQRLPAQVGGRVEAADVLAHNEGNAATGGIWRVRGPAGSAVLKVVAPPTSGRAGTATWQTSDEPAHWNFWRREVLAYTTGFAGSVYAGAGITAPALLDIGQRPDGAVELWLADVKGAPGTSWSVPRLAHFARQLGVAQARWAGRVPDLPWLSRRWLAQYQAAGPGRGVWISDDRDWHHAAVTTWPAAVREQLRQLWARRQAILAVAEAVPRTVCHLDVWPANLIDDGARTVLLDWSCAGEGGIGEDIANLIVDSVADGLMDAALLPDIAAAVTDAYITGLRDGGWHGAPDTVRHAVAACGAAKYCWLAPLLLGRIIRGETFGHPQYGRDASATSALQRLCGLATQLADWSRATLP